MSESVNPNNYGSCTRRIRIIGGKSVASIMPSDGDYKIDDKFQIVGNKIIVSYVNRKNKKDIIVETYERSQGQSAQPVFHFGMDLEDLLEKIESARKAKHEGKDDTKFSGL